MKRAVVILLFLIRTFSANPAPSDEKPVRIGLALSGGAALGFAHIGVLKVLEREGIPFSCITGNSMGAMVGGTYAAGYSATEIESIAVNANWSRLFSSNVPFGAQYLPERQQNQRYIFRLRHKNLFPSLPSGVIPLQNVEFLLMHLLSEIEYNTYYNFDSLPIPYRAITVDLITGKRFELSSGRLEQAIRASIAIPGVFSPEIIDSMELVDGGVQQYLPVYPLFDFEPDFIIAVLTMKKNEETGISLIDIISRTMDVVSYEDLGIQKELANVLIEPDVDPFSHSDFPRVKELIKAGEKAAENALPEIRAKLAGLKPVAERKKITKRPLPTVRSVRCEGLKLTRESAIYGAMQTEPGMLLDFDILIQDLTNIFNTTLFSDINYRLDFIRGDSVDLIIELQERDYGYYAFGIRYDNADNFLLGFEVGQGNLAGSGASVRAAVTLGNPKELRAGFTGTRLFAFPFGYRIDGFWGTIDHSYYEIGEWQADYNTNYYGGIAEAGYILGHNAFFDIGLKAHRALYQLPALPVFDTIVSSEWIIGPIFKLEFNNLNDLFVPSRGLTYRLNAAYSTKRFGAAKEFLKINFSIDQFLPLSSWCLLHPGFDLGLCFGELPWAEHFYSGGDNLVGFSKQEFTTKHKAVVRLGMDFRLFDLLNRHDYPLYLQLFSNLAYFDRVDRFVKETNYASTLHWGIGTGIRANTPFGPLHLIVGVANIDKSPDFGGTRFNYHFSMGREFRYTR